MKKLILMRGCPGSGKSTEAARIKAEAIADGLTAAIHSTDEYFMVDGVYVYDQTKISQYHRMNHDSAYKSMKTGVNIVIIDNTNVTAKDMYTYVEMAFDQGYEVDFAESKSPWWLAATEVLKNGRNDARLRPHAKVLSERNTHNVPEHVIMKMLGRYQCDLTLEEIISGGRS